jgi:hypothetical protein
MSFYFDEDVRIRIREAREMNRERREEKRERQKGGIKNDPSKSRQRSNGNAS